MQRNSTGMISIKSLNIAVNILENIECQRIIHTSTYTHTHNDGGGQIHFFCLSYDTHKYLDIIGTPWSLAFNSNKIFLILRTSDSNWNIPPPSVVFQLRDGRSWHLSIFFWVNSFSKSPHKCLHVSYWNPNTPTKPYLSFRVSSNIISSSSWLSEVKGSHSTYETMNTHCKFPWKCLGCLAFPGCWVF